MLTEEELNMRCDREMDTGDRDMANSPATEEGWVVGFGNAEDIEDLCLAGNMVRTPDDDYPTWQ